MARRRFGLVFGLHGVRRPGAALDSYFGPGGRSGPISSVCAIYDNPRDEEKGKEEKRRQVSALQIGELRPVSLGEVSS